MTPLEGIEGQPVEIQVVRLIAAVREQSKDQRETRDELRYMKHALWGLIFTVVGGMLLFLLSVAAGWLGSGPS